MAFIRWDVASQITTLDIFGFTLPITWYGLLFAAGFLIGQQLMIYLYRQDQKPISEVETLTLYVVLATVLGARLGHYLFYEWELLLASPSAWAVSMFSLPFRGLASHGATIGILVALYVYSRKRSDQPFLWITDRIAVVGALSGALIRLGNLLNSEIYGQPTSLPWGFVFVRETDPALLPLVPRHPTQLYEALFYLFLFGLTFYGWKYKRHHRADGFNTGPFLVLLFSFRFLVEFLKTNQEGFEAAMLLNMGQILSLPVVLVGLLIWVSSRKGRALRFPLPC
ncbi:prolipoprotein diacylglyceryl transferase [Larkinella harenae]